MNEDGAEVTTSARTGSRLAIVLIASLLLAACSHQQAAEASAPSPAIPNPAAASSGTGPAPSINSGRAWRYIKKTIAFGARLIGSANHKKLESYITGHLKGDQVEDDAFIADTPA